jgi:hypothetical protein
LSPKIERDNINTALGGKADKDLSTATITPVGGSAAQTMRAYVSQKGVVPDWFKQLSDGADDSPSITRALAWLATNGGTQLDFLSRVYHINTSITQSNQTVLWNGRAWQEPNGGPGAASPGTGTWFSISSSFIGSAASPILVQGESLGTMFHNIAFYEPQPAPGTGWAPSAYPYVLKLDNINGGVDLSNIMMLGVTLGVQAHIVPHLNITKLWGQAFQNLLSVDKAYDTVRIKNIHSWPFWSQDMSVLAYQQSILNVITLGRVDSPMMDEIFGLGSNSLIQIVSTGSEGFNLPGGSTTKLQIGSIDADFTRYGLWVASGSTTFQIGRFEFQGQTSSATTPATALTGAVAVEVDGQAIGQISALQTQFTNASTILLNNSTLPSYLFIGAQNSSFLFSNATSALAQMASVTPPHIVQYATQPLYLDNGGKTVTFKSPAGTSGLVYQPSVVSATP